MAVVQISKIQIRRGQEQTQGIPQLASGEMAWAIDTQKLYIGNGAVSEGAPAVGNTRILTETDNILDIAGQYSYKSADSNIQTGSSINYPVTRSLQEKLDDRVSSADYGIIADGTDQTANIQRAIDNLFLNLATKYTTESRVTLEFLPGTYKVSSTIYIPSHARIVGAGIQKTVFNFVNTGTSVFEFINDTSTATSRSTINTTTFINQPKYCVLKGFTVNTNDTTMTAFKLNAVRDSVFEDIEVTGGYGDSTVSTTSIAIAMYALSSVVTTQRNQFNRMTIDGFTYGAFAKQDIFDNTFTDIKIFNAQYGYNFGTGANLSSSGEQYGPRKNTILNNYFENVDRTGIYIANGYGNRSQNNTFVNVGNDGGGNANTVYSQINFISSGNTTTNDLFDRHRDLGTGSFSSAYINEVDGLVQYDSSVVHQVSLTTNASPTRAFRLPISKDTSYEINYVLSSNSVTEVRRGRITVATDISANAVQCVNDFEYAGPVGAEDNIQFGASIESSDLYIYYVNLNSTDVSLMTYTYRILS